MKKLNLKIILIIICFAICTNVRAELPEETLNKARSTLIGNCFSLFTGKKERLFTPAVGYQDYISKNRVFMIGEDHNGNQTCAYRAGGMLRYSHKELEDELCEYGKANNWKTCVLYAKDNDIVFVSVEELLDKANKLYSLDKIEETRRIINDINSRGLSLVPTGLRGRLYYLEGLTAVKGGDLSKTIDTLITSWMQYGYVDAAKSELDLLASQDINLNWKKIREAYYFIKDKGDTSYLEKYNQLLATTDVFYTTEQATKANEEKIQQEQEQLKRDVAEKESKIRAINDANESKERAKAEAREAKKLAEQQRIEQARAEKEAKKFAVLQKLELLRSEKDAKEQERRRLSEEKRLARVGDGTSDDYTCKSLGAKPSTNPYIQCRLKLTEQFNQRQLEQQQAQQMEQNNRIKDEQERLYQEQNREIQAEQKRLYQEQIQIQQRQQAEFEQSQKAAEKRRKLDALGDIFRAMEGSSRSRPSVSPTMPHFLRSQWYSQGNHMCSYDDGNVVNVGADICPIQR